MKENKKLEDYDFYEISPKRAREIGPFGDNDYSVTVTSYRQKENWKSMKAARAFYRAGANCCFGSERERYCEIVAQLDSGLTDVNDSCDCKLRLKL